MLRTDACVAIARSNKAHDPIEHAKHTLTNCPNARKWFSQVGFVNDGSKWVYLCLTSTATVDSNQDYAQQSDAHMCLRCTGAPGTKAPLRNWTIAR